MDKKMTDANRAIDQQHQTKPSHTKSLRITLFALVLGSAIMLAFREPPFSNIDNHQLQLMLEKNIPLYDVRRPEEWKQTGVIKDSRLLTFVDANGQIQTEFLNRFVAEVNKHDPVILICQTGHRTSRLAYHLMKKRGYTNVFNVDDGITKWIRENKPVIAIDKI